MFGELEMPSKFVKIVVYVPETDAERVREALGKAGAGNIGIIATVRLVLRELEDSYLGRELIPILGQ